MQDMQITQKKIKENAWDVERASAEVDSKR